MFYSINALWSGIIVGKCIRLYPSFNSRCSLTCFFATFSEFPEVEVMAFLFYKGSCEDFTFRWP
jgi:hypothetical protein